MLKQHVASHSVLGILLAHPLWWDCGILGRLVSNLSLVAYTSVQDDDDDGDEDDDDNDKDDDDGGDGGDGGD
eukprot:8755244-Karenia_brevis.AAC.1